MLAPPAPARAGGAGACVRGESHVGMPLANTAAKPDARKTPAGSHQRAVLARRRARLPNACAAAECVRAHACAQIPSHDASGLGLSAHMLHTLAHVELNAVDLAWDTLVRFAPLRLPRQFYEDFARRVCRGAPCACASSAGLSPGRSSSPASSSLSEHKPAPA